MYNYEYYSDDIYDFSLYVDKEITDQNLLQNNKLFRITYDSTLNKFKLITKNRDLLESIRNCFSDVNQSSFFVKQYGYQVENKLYAINKFGFFDVGLFFEIIKWIKLNYKDLSVLAISPKCKQFIDTFLLPLKRFISNEDKENFEVYNVSNDSGKNKELILNNKQEYILRDYQYDAISFLFNKGYGRGLIEVPTGGGKSFIIANFIWNLQKRFGPSLRYLILVPNKQLVEQFYSDLIDYGFSKFVVTKFTAGLKKYEKFNPDAKIVISNRQYIFKNEDTLPRIDCLICDEVHTATAEVSKTFIDKLKCPLKIGCSGTLPRNKYELWTLNGMFGPIIFKKDIVDLQNRGFISNLKINLIRITDTVVEKDTSLLFNINSTNKYKPDEFGYSNISFNDAYNDEINYFNTNYKELYTPILSLIKNFFGNTLILFDRIEFGSNMFSLAQEFFTEKQLFYIDGGINVKERENIRNIIEENSNCIIFGQSACVSTGLNFKKLHNIVFFFSGKSFSKVIQSIGRTLRLSSDKQFANLYDISFNFKYSTKHLSDRLKIYKEMYNKRKPDNIIKITI